jgi:hypothetical protein
MRIESSENWKSFGERHRQKLFIQKKAGWSPGFNATLGYLKDGQKPSGQKLFAQKKL